MPSNNDLFKYRIVSSSEEEEEQQQQTMISQTQNSSFDMINNNEIKKKPSLNTSKSHLKSGEDFNNIKFNVSKRYFVVSICIVFELFIL